MTNAIMRVACGLLLAAVGTCPGTRAGGAAEASGAGRRPVGDRPARLFSMSAANMSASRARRSCGARSYVEVLAPKDVRRPYPLVLIHGAAQTATNWMGSGRAQGWAEYFVEQGYVVYMIDQPMRGRSAWHPADGATRMFTAPAGGVSVHTAHREQGNLAAGKEAHAMAGRGSGQGPEGRSDLRCVTMPRSRDSHVQRGDASPQPGCRSPRCSTGSGPAVVLTHSRQARSAG